jgi:phosphoribosylformylglycinamidine cyclo-ligase
VGKLDATVCADVVKGIARGCRANGCALIGGETAEMPGMYAPGEYDLAGFIVGAVERKRMLTGAKIKAGDLLIGLPSQGLHTNGYSLARKLLLDNGGKKLSAKLADELLRIHRSYLKPLVALQEAKLLKGAAHITGGGLTDNIPRVLPDNCGVEILPSSWPQQPIFELLRKAGNIPEDDFRRTFNLGIGMVLVVSTKKIGLVTQTLRQVREPFFEIGNVVRWDADSKQPRVNYL